MYSDMKMYTLQRIYADDTISSISASMEVVLVVPFVLDSRFIDLGAEGHR